MYWCYKEQMLASVLLVTVDPREMSCAETALALAPLYGDLEPKDLLRPFLLMWLFKKLNFS